MTRIANRVAKLEERLLDKSPLVLFTTFGNPADEERITAAKRQAKAQRRPLKIWVQIYVDPDPRPDQNGES